MMVTCLSVFVLCSVGWILINVVLPPYNFPRNIPTVPFYAFILPIFYPIDQVEIYELYLKEHLEKYGAVKVFFGSRWNILVSKPQFLKQLFKDENLFRKSGNQKKIPYSLIAAYTGDNVISAHGDVWKLYRSTVTNGLQHFQKKPMCHNAKLFCKLIYTQIELTQNSVAICPLIQKLALANISQTVLGFDFGTLTEENCLLHEHLLRIKKKIFNPIFLTFPFLDLLQLKDRLDGFLDVELFRNELVQKVQAELIKNYKFEQTTFASSDLIRAKNNDLINDKQLTDNMVILLVAGHENPQVALTSVMYFLAKHRRTWQKRIRKELKEHETDDDLTDLPVLNSFLYETLRYLPPLSNIINRQTAKACKLSQDIIIPPNAYVGYYNYATTHNPEIWGSNADVFDPFRWGENIDSINNNWRKAKSDGTAPVFHGGKRACLGEKLALTELRVTIAETLKQFEWELHPNWTEKMTPAGPLCPCDLKLKFWKVNDF